MTFSCPLQPTMYVQRALSDSWAIASILRTPLDATAASQAPPPEFPSVLSFLSENTLFLTAWASSELRLMGTQVSARLEKILALESAEDAATAAVSLSDTPNGEAYGLDLETKCGELLQLVGEAGKRMPAAEYRTSVGELLAAHGATAFANCSRTAS